MTCSVGDRVKTASVKVTVQNPNVNPLLGNWTGTQDGLVVGPDGKLVCAVTPQYATVTQDAGNVITFILGAEAASDNFPENGGAAINGDGDSLSLSGSTLTWTFSASIAANGCGSFTGTKTP
jgi:hypothetical protein